MHRYFTCGILIACCLFLAGCGWQSYEAGLERTRAYAEYLEKLDQNLGAEWQTKGVALRVPKPFEPIKNLPGRSVAVQPNESENSDDGPAEDVIQVDEPWQEMFHLPGFLAAWEAELPVEGSDDDLPGYLAIYSSIPLVEEGDVETAAQFDGILVSRLTQIFDVVYPDETDWVDESYPPENPNTTAYAKSKLFLVTSMRPPGEINGVPMKLTLYLHENGPNKVLIVTLLPNSIGRIRLATGQVQFHDRMPLSLETLYLTSEKPTREGEEAAPDVGF